VDANHVIDKLTLLSLTLGFLMGTYNLVKEYNKAKKIKTGILNVDIVAEFTANQVGAQFMCTGSSR